MRITNKTKKGRGQAGQSKPFSMTSIAIKSQKTKFEIAREAMEKITAPKPVYEVIDFTDSGDSVVVEFEDQFGNEQALTITHKKLRNFITSFYNSTIDTFFNGDHLQYEDTRSAGSYFDDNAKEVLTDYLNNHKS